MSKNKTEETIASVADFINTIADPVKKADCEKLVQLYEEQTNTPARMWGAAIIGFGSYSYKYDSGHEGTAPMAAFSPRANAISIYLSSKFPSREALLQNLGKHKSAKACIYIKKLSDVNINVLKQLIKDGFEYTREHHC